MHQNVSIIDAPLSPPILKQMKSPALLLDSDRLLLRQADYARLRELAGGPVLTDELDRAIVVPDDRIPPDVITMDTEIAYRDDISGERREVKLVYPGEADATAGKISILAPVGMALIGLAVGQSIDWNFPDGKTHRLRVLQVRRSQDSKAEHTSDVASHAQ
jgi:regulator of nucleoside diphosphate kinase